LLGDLAFGRINLPAWGQRGNYEVMTVTIVSFVITGAGFEHQGIKVFCFFSSEKKALFHFGGFCGGMPRNPDPPHKGGGRRKAPQISQGIVLGLHR
jgi:hypothetical protein